MLCGNGAMPAQLTGMLARPGFTEGSSAAPADLVVEKAFVER